MSKYCGNCGCELEDNAMFCKNCGVALDAPGEIMEALEDEAEEIKETVSDKIEDVKEEIADAKEALEDKADEIKDTVSEKIEDVKEAAEENAEILNAYAAPAANVPAAPFTTDEPKKKGKKAAIIIVSSLIVLVAVAAVLWFFVFAKHSVVGKWEFSQNILDSLTNTANSESYATLSEAIDKDIVITSYYTFGEDGSFKMTVNEDDFKDRFEELIEAYVDSICSDPEAMLDSMGISVESLESLGMTLEKYTELVKKYSMEQLKSQIDSLVSNFEDDTTEGEKIISKGTYKYEDGVISIDYEGENAKDGTLTVTVGRNRIDIEKDDLTTSGALTGLVLNRTDG